jgi:hypothetical protein
VAPHFLFCFVSIVLPNGIHCHHINMEPPPGPAGTTQFCSVKYNCPLTDMTSTILSCCCPTVLYCCCPTVLSCRCHTVLSCCCRTARSAGFSLSCTAGIPLSLSCREDGLQPGSIPGDKVLSFLLLPHCPILLKSRCPVLLLSH